MPTKAVVALVIVVLARAAERRKGRVNDADCPYPRHLDDDGNRRTSTTVEEATDAEWPAGGSADPGCVRYFKHNYAIGCDRWHNSAEPTEQSLKEFPDGGGQLQSCNCFTRIGPPGVSGKFHDELPRGVFVDCSNLGLTALKPPRFTGNRSYDDHAEQIYPQADVFYANGNSLTEIRANTFGYQPHLKYLYLHNNPNLAYIEPGAFSNMTSLVELLLHYTALEVLPVGIFDDLPNLKILWLHNTGRLHSVEPGVFSQLHSLEELRLEHNNLSMSSLDYTASAIWPGNLKQLDLWGNERMVFKTDTNVSKKQACCSLCGFAGTEKKCTKSNGVGKTRCGIRAKNELPLVPYEDGHEQLLECCGDIDCGDTCSLGASASECQRWQLDAGQLDISGSGAATRANVIVASVLSFGALLAGMW